MEFGEGGEEERKAEGRGKGYGDSGLERCDERLMRLTQLHPVHYGVHCIQVIHFKQ